MKCDLHRHVGGAISSKTVHAILTKQGCISHITDIEDAMTFKRDTKRDFLHFLTKFRLLDEIKWNESAIELALKQVVWDIAREQIDYAELKFSTNKFIKQMKCSQRDIIQLAYYIIKEEAEKWGVRIALVLSLKYESNRDEQLSAAKIIDDSSIVDYIAGIDLVGDEAYFDVDFYAPIFRDWKKAGKGLIAHVGESQTGENVRKAIEHLNIDRIAHGLRADDDTIKLSKERNVAFDVAMTSNVYTGVTPNYMSHPIKQMIERGCIVTIGTDDPVVLDTTLDREYEILQETFGYSDEQLIEIMHNSVKHALVDLV